MSTEEQLERMQEQLHRMVDGLFQQAITREVLLADNAWPVLRVTFAQRDDPAKTYTLVVGIEPPSEDDT